MSRLVLDLCYCVHELEKMEFREKVEVPIHVAEFLSSFIRFVDNMFVVLDVHNINNIDDSLEDEEHKKSKAKVLRMTRYFTRLSKDFTMQTNIGVLLEKLYFLDVATCSENQLY